MNKQANNVLNIPTPYGTIPKHNKKNSNKTKKKNAPYPFFSSPSSSPFLSFFSQILFNKANVQEHVGFMPCTTFSTVNTQTSPLDIIVPISTTSPIDCCYTGKDDSYDNSSLSTSNSSSHSDWSLNSFDMMDLSSFEDDSMLDGNTSTTTATLSDILCEHYVQTKMQLNDCDDEVKDIPLETFRMFEAPSNQKTNHWHCPSITSLLNEPKEWTLVMGQQEKEQEKAVVEVMISSSSRQDELIPPTFHHTRGIRSNTAYLRMIVAEVNMMRADKIVGPLRPRSILPKRTDAFMHKPSPLKLSIT